MVLLIRATYIHLVFNPFLSYSSLVDAFAELDVSLSRSFAQVTKALMMMYSSGGVAVSAAAAAAAVVADDDDDNNDDVIVRRTNSHATPLPQLLILFKMMRLVTSALPKRHNLHS
jgi:hypothetical protein